MRFMIFLVALPMTILPAAAQEYLLSDFRKVPPDTAGWIWESFADRVMGGKSDLVPPAVVEAGGGKALRLAGRVVTKGGGFIQVRLRKEKDLFDASAYSGVEIEVDALPDGNYFLFLRTKDNFFPWSYYSAPIKPSTERSAIRIPWSAFAAESTGRKSVRADLLSSVALVAAFKDFDADLRIYRVAFYR